MKRIGYGLLFAGATLLASGCGKNGDSLSKVFSSDDSCSSQVAKTSILDIFVNAVEESARDENKSNADNSAALRFDLAKIRATTSEIGFALDDVMTAKKDPNSSKKFCEAQLTFTIPDAVLNDANAVRKDVGERSIQNLAEDAGFRVELNKFKSKISYSVQPTDAGDKLYTVIEGADHFTDLLALTVKYAAIKALRAKELGASTQAVQDKIAQENAAAEAQNQVNLENAAAAAAALAAAKQSAENNVVATEPAQQTELPKTTWSAGTILQSPVEREINLRRGPQAAQDLVVQIKRGSKLKVLKDKAVRVEDDGSETPWFTVELVEGQFCKPENIGARAECVQWDAARPVSGWVSSKAFLDKK